MIFSNICFVIMTGLIRYLAQKYPIIELVFFRALFGTLFVLPWILSSGIKTIYTKSPLIHSARSVCALLAMYAWFYAISNMPLSQATAINFAAPIFASIAAIIFLKEKVKRRRCLAILISFLGILIIIRPGIIEINNATFVALTATLLMALGATLVKLLTDKDHPNAVVFFMPLLLTFFSILPTIILWVTPSLYDFGLMIIAGFAATCAHQGLTRAFAVSEATAVLPYDYLRLPLIAAIGYFLFDEYIDFWVWAGSAIIFISSVYIAHRELKLGNRLSKEVKAARRTP